MKLTPKQRQMLLVLYAAKQPLPPGEIAFRCGYKGRPANHGGAGRAPMWTGRMIMNLPPGLVGHTSAGIELTYRGRRVAKEL